MDQSIFFIWLLFGNWMDGWGRGVFLEFNLEMEKEMEVTMAMITRMMKEKTKLEK